MASSAGEEPKTDWIRSQVHRDSRRDEERKLNGVAAVAPANPGHGANRGKISGWRPELSSAAAYVRPARDGAGALSELHRGLLHLFASSLLAKLQPQQHQQRQQRLAYPP
ncbi:hypothetical protein AJ80_08559 [Polytolypa hystricis UAMH7299]|uniref:Uncharacterized protein n=1 Tax=Polytolypa hystricis (strain UAMH7299) TaxID=1447883 RepID=A0A2B7WXX5_POLH7|nr:hypothetical protein AJ80_08559 [Polytolypa hystricis UAMH7299]